MAYLEYTKRNGDTIRISGLVLFILYITPTILAIAFCIWTYSRDAEVYKQQFLYEFNAAVNQELQQDDVKTVKSIAPGYCFDAEEWAAIWNFANKYNISEFPKYNGDECTRKDISRNLIAQLKAADEYVESNHIDKATASRLLNQAFAIANNNLVSILQLENN